MTPAVTVGLPVHNGMPYLEEALDALLVQSFDDIEIVVADNASTDDTPRVLAAAARRDERVRVHTNATNVGIAANHNLVVHLARGRLFKWASHDDVSERAFVERCHAVLTQRPNAIGVAVRAVDIDASGEPLGEPWPARPALDLPRPSRRCWDVLDRRHETFPFYALWRVDVLRSTRLVGPYPGGDRVLLAELALRGPIAELDEVLLRHRQHPQRATLVHGVRARAAAAWDPATERRRTYPHWRTVAELLRAVRLAPLSPAERLRCAALVWTWCRHDWQWARLVYDVAGPLQPRMDRWWLRRTGRAL